MTYSTLFLFSVGAAGGGMLRHFLGTISRPLVGILIANTLACFLLGLGVQGNLAVLVLGSAGALSTWSTLAKQIAAQQGFSRRAGLTIIHITLGLAALMFGNMF